MKKEKLILISLIPIIKYKKTEMGIMKKQSFVSHLLLKKIQLIIVFMLVSMFMWAQSTDSPDGQSTENLAKKSQNPVGDIISVPLEYWHHGGMRNGGSANVFMMKPVYPVTFGGITLINRLIIPFIGISANNGDADLGEIVGPFPDGKTTGLGNIQYQAFFTKADAGKVIVGLGPVFEFPTNTNNLGSSQWSAGPALVVLTMPGKWVIGALAQNLWSFAGPDDGSDVNQLVFQYFVNYNFGKGWYVTTTPIITSDWNKESGNQWTVPFGGGAGKMVRIGGKLPVDFKFQAFSNVVSPDGAPSWSMLFAMKFLFPTKSMKEKMKAAN